MQYWDNLKNGINEVTMNYNKKYKTDFYESMLIKIKD